MMKATQNVPNHVAVILDGNRRWSLDNGMDKEQGYVEGGKKFEEFLTWCIDADVKNVSAYVLSMENFNMRSKTELNGLFDVMCAFLKKWLQPGGLLDKHKVNVKFIGNINKLPTRLLNLIYKMKAKTKNYKKKFLNIMIAYSAKDEIAKAMQTVMMKIMKNKKGKVTPNMVEKNLSVTTPVDLVIRTGGSSRLSNFLLWQTAYSEMYTTKTLWPNFSKREFNKALTWYAGTKRNFGS